MARCSPPTVVAPSLSPSPLLLPAPPAPRATSCFPEARGTPGSPGAPGSNNIVLTGQSTGQIIDRGLFYNGSSYAAYDSGGFVRGLIYGTDANANASLSGVQTTLGTIGTSIDAQYVGSANPTTTSGAAQTGANTTLPVSTGNGSKFKIGQAITGLNIAANTWIANIVGDTLTLSQSTTAVVPAGTTLTPYNSVSAQTTDSLNTLDLSGVGASLTLASGATLSVNGILRSGGSSGVVGAISGGTAIRAGTSGGELVVRTDTADDTLEIKSVIQDNTSASSLTKTGAGTLKLFAANTFTGKILVNGGTLGINTDASLGATGSSAPDRITLNNGATLRKAISGSAFTINANRGITLGKGMQYITNAGGPSGHLVLGSVITGPGGMTYASDDNAIRISAANTYTGDTWLNNGATLFHLQGIQNSTFAGGTVAQPWSPTGTYVFGGLKGSSNLTLKASIGLSIGNNNQDTTYSGILGGVAGDLGLTKIGTGTLTLAGANSYAGATKISAGTLALGAAGSVNGSSGIELATGAVLDTSAKSSYAMPATPKSITFHVDGTGAGSCGRIHAAGLDITSAVVVLTVDNALDDAAYVLATYTSLTGTGFANVTGLPVDGSYTLDYAYNGGTQIALVASGAAAYDTWSASLGDNKAFDVDADGNGIANGLQWILGGTTSEPNPSAILPTLTGDAAGLTLIFTRNPDSIAETTLMVDWDTDLDAFAHTLTIGAVDVPASGDNPTIDIDAPTTGKVTVVIPAANAPGGRLFARLRATMP